MKLLNVIFNGWGERWQLGTLADNGKDILFEYSPEALRRDIELALSSAATCRSIQRFSLHQHRLPGLLADSLPDGWGMPLMDRLFRKQGRPQSSISPLDRLAFIGERGMGALSYVPHDPVQLTAQKMSSYSIWRWQRKRSLRRAAARAIGTPRRLTARFPPQVLVQFDPETRSNQYAGQSRPGDNPG
jgi:serine/threonine-protein kinase HipA